MKVFKTLATVALAVTLLTGCTNPFNKISPIKSNTIMTINGEPISQNEFQKTFDMLTKNPMFAQMGIDLRNDKNSIVYLMLKDGAVNELIVKNLLE